MDNLANLFSALKNAQTKRLTHIIVPFTKKSWNICYIFYLEGFLQGFHIISKSNDKNSKITRKKINYIKILLKYEYGIPAIQKIKKISLFGRRIYNGVSVHKAPANSLYRSNSQSEANSNRYLLATANQINLQHELKIMSTSKGILTERDTKLLNIGGEIICVIS